MGGVLCVKWYHLWAPDSWHGSYWFPGHPLSKSAFLFLRRKLRWSKYTVSKQRWYPTGAQLLQSLLAALEERMDEREAGDEMMRLRPGALGQMILWVLEMLESVLDGFLTRVTSHVLLKRCAEGPYASCGESSQSLPRVSY